MSTEYSQATVPQVEWVKWGFISFQTLATGCELGLFPFVSQGIEGGRTAEEIANYLQAPKHSVRVLLLACCANGLLRKEPKTEQYFSMLPSGTDYEILRLQVQFAEKAVYPAFQHLTESLKSGQNSGLKALPGRWQYLI